MAASDRKPTVLAVGLNPAWQRTLRLERFVPGEVNRAATVTESAAGKGVNLARAATALGAEVTVAQFAGGRTGEQLEAALDAAGIRHLTVRTQAVTRVCTTVLSAADRSMTELIDPSGPVTPDEVAALEQLVLRNLPRFAAVAVSGTYPPGVPPDLYGRLLRAAVPHAFVLLDACRGVEPALAAGPHLLKINRAELLALTGLDDPPAALRALQRQYPIRAAAVTAGAAPTVLTDGQAAWAFHLPRLQAVVSPLGAGDCVAGALLSHLLLGAPATATAPLCTASCTVRDLVEPLAQALACASASCLTPLPAEFDPAMARRIRADLRIERLWTSPQSSAE